VPAAKAHDFLLVANRPDGSLAILALTVAMAAKADRPSAKHLGLRASKNELYPAVSHPDGGCRLAAAEGHGKVSTAGDPDSRGGPRRLGRSGSLRKRRVRRGFDPKRRCKLMPE
jgi:hypothetical protein